MMPVKCLSSSCMVGLMEWRNLPAAPVVQRLKLVATEGALFLLNTLALIESIAYASLALVAYTFKNLIPAPYEFAKSMLDSSAFTWAWTALDLIFNFSVPEPLFSRESEARHFAQQIIPQRLIHLYRREDQNEIAAMHPPGPAPAPAPAAAPGAAIPRIPVGATLIEQGADFLIHHIAPGMDAPTRALLTQVDADVVQLLLTKTVFVYTLGDLRHAPIPRFLKHQTQQAITALRAQVGGRVPSPQLANLFNQQDLYDAGLPAGHPEEALFGQLRNAGALEMQASQFLQGSWGMALPHL